MSSNPKCLLWAVGAGHLSGIARRYNSFLSLQLCQFILHKKGNEQLKVTSHGTCAPKMPSSHMPVFQRWPVSPSRKIFASFLCTITFLHKMLTPPGEQICLCFSSAILFAQLLARHYATAFGYGMFSAHHQILMLPRSSQTGEEMFGSVFAGFALPDWRLLTQQMPKIKVNFTISLCPCRT